MSPRTGRPPKPNARKCSLNIRITEEEKEEIPKKPPRKKPPTDIYTPKDPFGGVYRTETLFQYFLMLQFHYIMPRFVDFFCGVSYDKRKDKGKSRTCCDRCNNRCSMVAGKRWN